MTIFARENLSLFLQSQSLQLALWVELILLFLVYPSIEIIDLPSTFVINGLKSDWLDYEDFLQYETAIASNCDCIITRNPDDFSMSRLPVYNALDFMLSLRNG